MQHLDEGTIHAWLDGALSADEAERVELHVASCEGCSDAVAEARGLIAASTRILTALDNVPRVSGARGGRRDQGGRGSIFPVRWRIAAAVAVVIGGGALALAGRFPMARVALDTGADTAGELALVMADSPVAAIQELPVAQPRAQVRSNAVPGRGGIGGVTGSVQPRQTGREGDLASVERADSAPPVVAQLDVHEAAAPPAAPSARTDDTARLPVELAAANRVTTDARADEARSSAAQKAGEAVGGVRRAAGAFAEPVAPQARLRAAPEVSAPRLLTEERVMDAGRVVVRRVYRVEETLVTLDERAPLERAQREEQQAVEERVSRVEAQAYAQAPSADSTTARVSTIRWVDTRGTEFTLSGPAPQAQLERFRRLLGY